MADEAKDTKSPKWPYTSFKSLLNVVQRFKENALPPRVDRSVLGGSEGQKTQILAAMKFLGLIQENGDTTDELQRLVDADDKPRQVIVRELLARYYPDASALAKINATTKQLEETFAGLSGDTLRKALAFYLHAAKYAQHPVSKNFKVPGTARVTGARKKRTTSNGEETPAVAPPVVQSAPMDAKARYLDMLLERAKSGDTLDTGLLDRIEKVLGFSSDDPTTDSKE